MKSKLIEIKNLPQSSVGAPLPCLLTTEQNLRLLYYVQNTPENWDGKNVRSINVSSPNESVSIVNFPSYHAYKFGPPNDEAIAGHPLYKLGLQSYSFFEVENSNWIADLEKMNSVHRYHKKAAFLSLRHYIFTFHDSTFECAAKAYESRVEQATMAEVYIKCANEIFLQK